MFRYRSLNIDQYPNKTFDNWILDPWISTASLQGCVDLTGHVNYLAGNYVYMWEVTRDGVTETGMDTILVAPGINDLIEISY